MSFAAALLVAAAVAAQPAPPEAGQGAQVESARIAVEILRPAVLRDGVLVSAEGDEAPRTQTLRRDGRISYEFE